VTTAEKKLRAARFEHSAEEHAALRVEAARQDISQAQLARNAVRESLAGRKGGGR
jgi:hypothetical protein